MASILLALHRLGVLGVPALLVAGAALAQASSQPKTRQPTLQSVRQQEDVRTNANMSQSAENRKLREMDRRLNRTLRSVCVGC